MTEGSRPLRICAAGLSASFARFYVVQDHRCLFLEFRILFPESFTLEYGFPHNAFIDGKTCRKQRHVDRNVLH